MTGRLDFSVSTPVDSGLTWGDLEFCLRHAVSRPEKALLIRNELHVAGQSSRAGDRGAFGGVIAGSLLLPQAASPLVWASDHPTERFPPSQSGPTEGPQGGSFNVQFL